MHLRGRVLIVAYLFPPIGGIAVQRPLKFARYLPECGLDPIVLTTKDAHQATMDESLLEEIPSSVPVIRVGDPLGRLAVRAVAATGNTEATGSGGKSASWKASLKQLLRSIKNVTLIPDEHVLWALRAVKTGAEAIKEYGIDTIYTTSGPHSTHLAGYLMQRLTGARWVADFRDPWTDNLHYQRTGLGKLIDSFLERLVFRNADQIITVTDGFKSLFEQKYPVHRSKFYVIRNGIDPNDFPLRIEPTYDKDSRFTFFYAGILYPKRSPAPFLHALANVLGRGDISEDDVQAEFAGVFDYPGYSENHDLVRDLGLENVVQILGYMPRHDALSRMQTADGLLLIGENVPEAKMYVAGKLYEYLYSGRPVLAFLEDGEAARLLHEAEAGIVCHPDDILAIEQAIVTMVRTHKRGQALRKPNGAEQQYTRQAQTKQLADLVQHRNQNARRVADAENIPS